MDDYDVDSVLGWRGRTALDGDGQKLGKLSELFLGPSGQRLEYGEITAGALQARHRTIVPLAGASERDGDVRLAIAVAALAGAPEFVPGEQLTEAEALLVRRHFGTAAQAPGELVRHEEEATVSAGATEPVERVRVRKVTVTEQKPVVVAVRKEVIALETEPPAGTIESSEALAPDDPGRAGEVRELGDA